MFDGWRKNVWIILGTTLIGFEFQRLLVILVLFELLQLFYIQKRVQIVLHIIYVTYVNCAVVIDYAACIAMSVMYATIAIAYHTNALVRRCVIMVDFVVVVVDKLI